MTTDCSFNCRPIYTNLHKLISKFMSWVNSGNIWAFHLIFGFSFWLTKLPKMKIGCMIFCTNKTKMKNNKKQTNYYVIFLFFVTFVNQNEKHKMGWKAHRYSNRNNNLKLGINTYILKPGCFLLRLQIEIGPIVLASPRSGLWEVAGPMLSVNRRPRS